MIPEAHQEMRTRTKQFALRVIRLSQSLPDTKEARVLGMQVLRSGTSMAANYRAAGRSRSKADFISKIGIAVEEADETVFWLELLVESGLVKSNRMARLMAEANELLAILSASRRTAKS